MGRGPFSRHRRKRQADTQLVGKTLRQALGESDINHARRIRDTESANELHLREMDNGDHTVWNVAYTRQGMPPHEQHDYESLDEAIGSLGDSDALARNWMSMIEDEEGDPVPREENAYQSIDQMEQRRAEQNEELTAERERRGLE